MRWEQLAPEDQQLIQNMALEAAKVSAGGELHPQTRPYISRTLKRSILPPSDASSLGADPRLCLCN